MTANTINYILIGVGLFGLVASIVRMVRGKASMDWATTTGQVLVADVICTDTEEQDYKPKVVYEYQVFGEQYTGERITFGGLPSTRTGAIKKVQQYPIGAQVTVYYHPEKPKHAVLEPGSGGSNWVGVIVSLGLFVFGLLKLIGMI